MNLNPYSPLEEERSKKGRDRGINHSIYSENTSKLERDESLKQKNFYSSPATQMIQIWDHNGNKAFKEVPVGPSYDMYGKPQLIWLDEIKRNDWTV